jgi:hypothetical protein
VEDPGRYHETGDDGHFLDIAIKVGLETSLQKTILNTPPHVFSGAVPVLGEQAAKPGVVARPVGQSLPASMLSHDSWMGRRGHVREDQPNKAWTT